MNFETVACERPMRTMEGAMDRMDNAGGSDRPMRPMEVIMDRMEDAVLRAEILNARLVEIVFANITEPPKNPALVETTLTDVVSNKLDRLQLVNDRTEYICGALSELLGSIKLQEGC